jgi:hypothetical protein
MKNGSRLSWAALRYGIKTKSGTTYDCFIDGANYVLDYLDKRNAEVLASDEAPQVISLRKELAEDMFIPAEGELDALS